MRLVKLYMFFIIIFCASPAWTADIYVSTDGNDSTGDGTVGTPYLTIQKALSEMSVGDTIVLRGGEYDVGNTDNCEAVPISTSLNGSAWTAGNYNTIKSYAGEWAIIDGESNAGTCGVVFGLYNADDSGNSDLKFWKFERLEIKNAVCASDWLGGRLASAINVNGGPIWVRYCYLHDNAAPSGAHNPAVIHGYHLHDSIIEYNLFSSNNPASESDENSSDICTINSYSKDDTVASNGYSGWSDDAPDSKGNIIRYNYFAGGNVGYKYKGGTVFTGRVSEHSWDNTYDTYGDDIHHNIFGAYSSGAMHVRQDFAQIHHNIIDGGAKGILPGYYEENDWAYYKQAVYNNTVMNMATLAGSTPAGAICRFVQSTGGGYLEYIYGYDYNNIIDNCSYGSYGSMQMTVGALDSGSYDLSNYYNTKNYWYRPTNADIIRLNDYGGHTQAEFEAQEYTHTPRVAYQNDYDAENLLYQGTTGADKYRVRSGHTIEVGVTAGAGGSGGSHPYLDDVTIPSYVGAANPSDDDWVAGVLAMDASYFTGQENGSDPTWIEGAEESPTGPNGGFYGCNIGGSSRH